MTLESLKEDYKKTFTEPRLSGRFLSPEIMKKFSDGLEAAKTLDEFIDAIIAITVEEESFLKETEERKKEIRKKKAYHVISRILCWNDEPPVDENGNRIEQTK